MSRRSATTWSVACLLAIAFAATTFASDSNENTLQGSWEGIATIRGEVRTALLTFHEDGTLVTTSSNTMNSNAHGAWEKIGPRIFTERNRSFTFDASGQLLFVVDSREIIELSKDGQSYASEVVSEIRLPSGQLVSTISFSASATRIRVDL